MFFNLQVRDRCGFFKWVDNELRCDDIGSQGTSSMTVGGGDDHLWRKNVDCRLRKLENQNWILNVTLMGCCCVVGFLLGMLLKS